MTPQSSMAKTVDALRLDVTVQVAPEHAFDVFVNRMVSWWPKEHHTGEKELVDIRVPSTVGETWGEVDEDGLHGPWGHVLEHDAPHRVRLSWGLQPEDWEYDADQAKHSELEITFTPIGDGATRVDFVHAKFENHGAGGQDMRDSVGSPNGWSGMLTAYAALATT